jgi:hypothetical protein
MRKAICAVVVLAAFAAFADETPVKDSPLVALAKKTSANRKKAKVVITDANLAHGATGSVTTTSAQPATSYAMPQFTDSLYAPQTAPAQTTATAATATYSRYPVSTNQMKEVTSSVATVAPPTSTVFNNPATTVTPYTPPSSVTVSQPASSAPTSAPPVSQWQ